MKAVLPLLILLGGTSFGLSQGTVNFINTGFFATTADRYVYVNSIGGTKLTNTNYVAALYFGTTECDINQLAVRSEADQSLLSAVGHFRDVDQTSALAGTWAGGMRYLLGTTVGQMLLLQVRVWDITRFATFDAAFAGGGYGSVMQTCPFNYTVPASTDALGNKMDNFRGLPDGWPESCPGCVPEPGVFGLAVVAIGLAISFGANRRKGRRQV